MGWGRAVARRDQPGVVFFSPCFTGPVGDALERPDFFAAALSETAPLECVFLLAVVLPPLLSLVDWGMCFLVSPFAEDPAWLQTRSAWPGCL